MTGLHRRRVSVVVPTRDRPAMLRQALASIRALEGPDLEFEILVGDNGSERQTKLVAAEFRATHLPVSRKGAAAARNAALRAAAGDYIAFLDDDDVWLPVHIREHLSFLDAHPDFGAIVGQVVCTDPDLRPTGPAWPTDVPSDGDLFMKMMSGYFPQIGATVIRAKIREAVGEFDETLIGDQDWDWQLRVARDHKVGFVEQVCILFRQRPSGTFDDLQLKRVPYTRRVFFRHALPAYRRWNSPVNLLRSYFRSVQTYHNYFIEAAVGRAERGERRSALYAIWNAFRILPTQTVRHLLRPTPVQRAFLSALDPRRRGAPSKALR
jgi:glycosyltransferase involved in cell wall biosynthesis